jgi:hypothetical protein
MSCDLFERDGLLQLEQGVELDPHFATCPDCREARRVYAQLGQQIAELDSAIEPSPAWKAAVWERIDRQRQVNSVSSFGGNRTMRWIVPAAAVAMLGCLVVLAGSSIIFWHRMAAPPLAPNTASLTAAIYSGQTSVRRGDDAHPGDRLHLAGTVAGYEQAELRVYFNDKELAAQCSAETPCKREGNTISMTTTMRSLGSYRPVLIVSNQSIPAAVAGLDQDASAALNAGGVVKAGDPIPVR